VGVSPHTHYDDRTPHLSKNAEKGVLFDGQFSVQEEFMNECAVLWKKDVVVTHFLGLAHPSVHIKVHRELLNHLIMSEHLERISLGRNHHAPSTLLPLRAQRVSF